MNPSNQDWQRPDLLEFPKLDPLLRYLKDKEHESHLKIIEESNRRRQIEIEKQLEKLDNEINLKRILRNDKRYLGIGQQQRSRKAFFDPITMGRIVRQATKKTIKGQRTKIEESNENSIDPKDFPQPQTSCSRFIKNTNLFDSKDATQIKSSSSSLNSNNNNNNKVKPARKAILPPLIVFKRSEDSDIVNHHLELEQFIDMPIQGKSNRSIKNEDSMTKIQTSISILRPKYT